MTRKPTPRPESPEPTSPRRDMQDGAAMAPETGAAGVPEKPAPQPETESAGRPGDRIAKVLSRAGVASRRDAEKMIAEGRVAVNGKVIDSPALNITGGARITVDGKPIAAAEPARMWLYHKPTGLVTTTKDEQGRDTIFDALPEDMPRVLSVGRLDLNSEGLLLLTNDGGIKRQLELPSTGWLRRYRVRVKGDPTEEMLEPLREGIVVDREEFQPMIVSIDRQQGANAWLTIALREGKNREIRRALENVGLVVNRLIRVSYGPFQLGTLKVGAVEEIKRRVMRDQLGLEPEDEETAAPAPRKRLVRKSKPAGIGSDITEETFGGRGRPGAKAGPKAGPNAGPKSGAKFAPKSGPRAGGGTGSKPAGSFEGRGAAGGKPGGKSFGGRPGESKGYAGKGYTGKGEGRPSEGRSAEGRGGATGGGRTFSSGGAEAKPGGPRRFASSGNSGASSAGPRPTAANPGFSKPSTGKPAGKPSGGRPSGGKPAGRGPGGPKGPPRGKPRDRG